MCSSPQFLQGFEDNITISASIPVVTGGNFFNNVCYNYYVRESLLSMEGCIKYTNTFLSVCMEHCQICINNFFITFL